MQYTILGNSDVAMWDVHATDCGWLAAHGMQAVRYQGPFSNNAEVLRFWLDFGVRGFGYGDDDMAFMPCTTKGN